MLKTSPGKQLESCLTGDALFSGFFTQNFPLRVCRDGLLYNLARLVGAHEDVARLAALARADDAEFRHRVDEARRARVADAEPALDAA